MELEEFKAFIGKEHERLNSHYGEIDQEKKILARTVKLAEELGELCSDVLAHTSLQRDEKLQAFGRKDIGEEFADVIITAFLLARAMGIDIEAGIESKMGKIRKRHY
jgi:NTP pyrophosphatase (non-canonical NTP hydrolase)